MITLEELRKKAKAYDEAIERAKKFIEENPLVQNLNTWIKETFPELRESEDERIRKEIITLIQSCDKGCYTTISPSRIKEYTAWLEKQGEQKECTPLFRVGDTLKKKGKEYTFIVDRIQGGFYHCDHNKGAFFPIEKQDSWELVEQKPAWSEEEEVKINRIVACLENLNVADNDILLKDVDWLKSLKARYTWKPSDEQMADLWNMLCECRPADHQLLQDIYYGLKKLKGE